MTIYSKYTSIYKGDGFFKKIFNPTFKNANYYHFVRGEKREGFINPYIFFVSSFDSSQCL